MGAVNGCVIAFIGVNPVITTLATAFVYQGMAVWLAGPGFTDFPDFFKVYGQSKFLGVQGPVWYMLIATVLFHGLMSNSRFFRNFYFVGGSKARRGHVRHPHATDRVLRLRHRCGPRQRGRGRDRQPVQQLHDLDRHRGRARAP